MILNSVCAAFSQANLYILIRTIRTRIRSITPTRRDSELKRKITTVLFSFLKLTVSSPAGLRLTA